MLLQIPNLLSPDQVSVVRRILDTSSWVDGRVTAGHQSAQVKRTSSFPKIRPPLTSSAAWFSKLSPKTRYLSQPPCLLVSSRRSSIATPEAEFFGTHVDNAIREIRSTGERIRTDLSATLFLSQPQEYEGGELVIEDTYGIQTVKLPAGHMILYPATSLHHVRPVTQERASHLFLDREHDPRRCCPHPPFRPRQRHPDPLRRPTHRHLPQFAPTLGHALKTRKKTRLARVYRDAQKDVDVAFAPVLGQTP